MKKKLFAWLFVSILFLALIPFNNNSVKADGGTSSLGWELLDDESVLHIWNRNDSYYFNVSNGIQFSNHYQEYWTRNVLMLGYYGGDTWNLLYRTDELTGFNKDIDTDNNTYINITIWKDLSYSSYDFRFAIRYHLGVDDLNLTVIPYIKNLGASIPFDLAFGWEMKDINIVGHYNNNEIEINNTRYNLHQELNEKYINVSRSMFVLEYPGYYLYLDWNSSLDYLVQVKSRPGQYNAPVTLFIRIGTLGGDQEKQTELFWYDSILTLRPNAEGFITQWDYQDAAGGSQANNYDRVDEAVADDDTTVVSVWTASGDQNRIDVYNFSDVTSGGEISLVKVFFRAKHGTAHNNKRVRPICFVNDTYYYGTWVQPVFGSYTNYDTDTLWANHPHTSVAWTWTDINNAQFGYEGEQQSGSAIHPIVTQIYVEIDYTPTPYATTNATTGVEERNATLHGYVHYNMSEDCTVRFEYGTTTSYGTNTTNQSIGQGNEFEANITGLSPGTLYHYRTYINSTSGNESTGVDMTFYTKPEGATDFNVTTLQTGLRINWTKGEGAVKTTIVRNESGYGFFPVNVNNGTVVYNGYANTFLDMNSSFGFSFFYSGFSWTGDKHSDNYTSDWNYSIPAPPSNMQGDLYNYDLNISWVNGTGANTTLLRKKIGSYPSSPTDGTQLYNGTGTYYNDTNIVTNTFYSAWSYNTSLNMYSNANDFTFGGLQVNCYDENNHTNLTFDIFLSNANGSEVYENTGCINTHLIDVGLCPTGEKIGIFVSADNHESRVYYMDVFVGSWITLNAYLPLSLPPEGKEDPENETYSHLYRFIVVNEIDQTLEDAKMDVLRYINESDEWTSISILFTDANGQVDVYLLAGQGVIYKIRASKDEYITQTVDFIPDPDYYGAYYPKTIRLIREAVEQPEIITGFDIITWDAYFLSGDNTTLYVDYLDSTGNTTTGNIQIYTNGTNLSYTYNFTSSSFSITWTNGNHTLHDYKIVLNIAGHPDITEGNFSDIRIIGRYQTPDESMFDFSWALEVDFVDVLGENPLGWVNLIVFFLGTLIVVSVGKQWAGLGIIGLGAILFVVQRVIGLPGFTIVQLAVIPFFILYGFLTIIARNKKEVRI